MAYFHEGDFKAKTTFDFYPCQSTKLYLSGLRNGDFVRSETPYYFQNQDGRVVGIDTRFTEFKVFDVNQNIINALSINWKVDCGKEVSESKTEILGINNQTDHSRYQLSGIMLICFVLIAIWLFMKRKRVHQNENQP